MDKPLVSIITPTYNHEKFIKKCIESVLSQSYPHWEQLIIDDGSTDKTEQIIKEYSDERIKYFKQKNKGIWRLNENYNKALQYSEGQIIAVLEGDDYWPKKKLETQISTFKDPNVVLSWGKAVIVNEKNEIIGYYPNSFERFKKLESSEAYKNLFFGDFIPACTVMCRKSVLNEINGFIQPKNIPFVDYPTWLSLGAKGKLACVDGLLGFFRHHNKQISSTMVLEMFKSMQYSIQFFKNMDKPIRMGIRDLIRYDINQIQHNISYYKENRSLNKNKENKSNSKININISFSTLFILFLRIYFAFKTNTSWTMIIIRNKIKKLAI
ncbi:MAG: glycosyltransferase [Methanobacteriaceae archaeon]|nr:glycosyltransferase [Methanobacteriaceae archaeon]